MSKPIAGEDDDMQEVEPSRAWNKQRQDVRRFMKSGQAATSTMQLAEGEVEAFVYAGFRYARRKGREGNVWYTNNEAYQKMPPAPKIVERPAGAFPPLVAGAKGASGREEASQYQQRKRPVSARSPTSASITAASDSRRAATAPSPSSPSLASPAHKRQDAKLSPASAAAARMQDGADDDDMNSLEKDVDGLSPDLLQKRECFCCLLVLTCVVWYMCCSLLLTFRPSCHGAAPCQRRPRRRRPGGRRLERRVRRPRGARQECQRSHAAGHFPG
jgi:hypothetical protein